VTACQPQIIQCDDLSLAMTGIPTGDLWITRLRANLPAGALTADLILEATASQDQAPSFHATSQYTIANYNPCGKSSSSGAGASSSSNDLGCMCHTAKPSTRYADAIGVMLSVFVLGGVVRRRRHTP
jgi:hypothetical protein